MITHHPSETTLMAYATGSLPEALGLVTATHLGRCAACRGTLAALEAVGGTMLEAIEPVPMEAGALDLLPSGTPAAAAPPPVLHPDLPPPFNRVPAGRWWPIGPGLRWRPLRVAGGAWAGLLLAQPNRSLPRHGHDGLELTCVLSGAFTDDGGTYQPGDLSEPDTDHDRPPMVIGTVPCLCVIASEGMRFRGLLGWVQRAIGQ